MEERFLATPFLPEKQVALVAIDGRCNGKTPGYPNLVARLADLNIRVLEVPVCPSLYQAIGAHPDIQFHPVDGKNIVIAPNAGKGLAEKLLAEGFSLIEGKSILTEKYPANVAYNVARIGNLAFHRLDIIDPVLREELMKRGVELIHVKQGYSKCSALILGNNLLITEDRGLWEKATAMGINTLLVESGFVQLPALNYGFLGGTGGLIAKNKIAITGDITLSSSYLNIIKYLKDCSCGLEFLSQELALDIGSLVPLKEWA